MTSSVHAVKDAADRGGRGAGVALVIRLHGRDWPGPLVMSHISKLLLSFEPRLRQRKWRHFKRSPAQRPGGARRYRTLAAAEEEEEESGP